jgi:chromosome segregation protein
MRITRLRLLGFKSFVEPTELMIEPGLTGVVGPNGCGKSNLLEALRWVMGETSHKSMRAEAMDDVIFSGTTARPARNTAEVTIFLDNTRRQAPAEYNDADVLEITRRIERDAGSAYRINGREVRARDVKILFEDAATGARSPALVRQGQIAEIVNAKPEQRRRVLEDAAGIAGLHSRRHEAELRLKGAENNLARLNDIMGQLNSQAEALKRQARQARRYKDLSAEIRGTEALLSYLSWTDAQAQVAAEESNFAEALAGLGAATETESGARREEAELSECLPPLREAEAARAAAVGRLKIECEALEREAARVAERQREIATFADTLESDMRREASLIAEATDTLARLDEESTLLGTAEDGAEREQEKARAELEKIEAELAAVETRLQEVTSQVAEARAHRQSLEAAESERKQAVARICRQLAALEAQARDVGARAPDIAQLTAVTEHGQRLAREIADIDDKAMAAEERAKELFLAAKAANDRSAAAQLAAGALTAECTTLMKLVMPARDDLHPPVVGSLRVDPGYEAALVASLGDDLDAPASAAAPVHWRHIDASADDPALPADAEPLSRRVKAPKELARRLSQIGVVAREQGVKLQPHLKVGQRLVSREGDLWRWDGFVAAAGGSTPAAQRLAERNRLTELLVREQAAQSEAQAAAADAAKAAEAYARAASEEQALRQLAREKRSELSEARERLTLIERAARDTESKLAAIAGARTRTEAEREDAEARLAETTRALAGLGAEAALVPQLKAVQVDAQHRRALASEARTRVVTLEREHAARRERLTAIAAEKERWQSRCESAKTQIATLRQRRERAAAELESLSGQPALTEKKRQGLMSALAAAEKERQAASDELAAVDTRHRAAVKALREAQNDVAGARETRARCEARLEAARSRRQDEVRRIRETFEVAPEECLVLARREPGAALPPLAEVDRDLQRLKADRERLGGVNLQADEELTVLLEQLASMETERSDVEQAIAKLRSAITQLNREGKKRLDDAFETVNSHFQRLFTTLFGGGEARLEMIEAEDPLEGGLEIVAKPPGKKPATLSLLSGGEQSLTALALIFAVFLTNPSPICVLDEVDAPLDDANVDRFCTLMEKMAAETATRFLVITHHPMTMARMSRLFGVTMAEKGISQLVSVDLESAQRLREAV